MATLRRPVRPAIPLATFALLATLLATPAGASAATGSQRFMGMNPGGLPYNDAAKLDAALGAVRKRGAGAVRLTVYWSSQQPYAQWSDVPQAQRSRYVDVGGRPIDFVATDRFIAAATANKLDVLPTILGTPRWASTNPSKPFAPPTDPAQFGRFGGALARRYGTKGSFWKQNPKLPRRPVRDWQIWNEPAGVSGFGFLTTFWDGPLDTQLPGYAAMLRASRKSLKRADPKARVVLSGFASQSWKSLAQIYEAGLRKQFDTVTIHPYARSVSDVLKVLRLVRKVMKRNGDSKKPLLVTEFGWTSARGRVPNAVPSVAFLELTEDEQASLLQSAYRGLWEKRSKLRLRAAYWFTWATTERSKFNVFEYSGLYRLRDDGSFAPKPAAAAYRKVAARLRRADR